MEVGQVSMSAVIENLSSVGWKDPGQVGIEQGVFAPSAAVVGQRMTADVGVKVVTVVEMVYYGLVDSDSDLLGPLDGNPRYGERDTDSEDWEDCPSKRLR